MRERVRLEHKRTAQPLPEDRSVVSTHATTDPSAATLVSKPSDPLEVEAGHVAEDVMRPRDIQTPDATLREVRGTDTSTGKPAVVQDTIASDGGRPLDADTRTFMESRFGHDFRNVR